MNSLPPFKPIPRWQDERARRLQRACESIRLAVERGQPIGRTISRVARRHHGKPFRCDPSRRLALSAQTLRRIWDAWNEFGQLPAAFRLNYTPRVPRITPPIMIRFAKFCANRRHPSLRAAWDKFSAQRGNFGAGRKASEPLNIKYGQVLRYFPTARFYLIQAEIKAVEAAQLRLAKLRLEIIAEIRHRLPDRTTAPRLKIGPDFTI